MALPELRGSGRLLSDPRTGTGKTRKPWASAVIKFPTWRKTEDGWEETEGAFASVMAFDELATTLASYAKGDEIGVHGSVKPTMWKDRPQLAVTASQIWTPEKSGRTVRTPARRQSSSGLSAARAAASAALRQVDARRSADHAGSAV